MGRWWIVPLAMVGAWFMTEPSAKASPGFTPPQGGSYGAIREIAGAVERRAGIPGFASFALAVADRESNGNNTAANTSRSEAAAACSLYRGNRNTRYKNNPYPEERWCFGSGGWYGFMPATALATQDFYNADPYLIFDPVASTVLFADYVRRVAKGFFGKLPSEHRNWLTVRRFMSSNRVGMDYDESMQRSQDVRRRFAADLRNRGIDPNFMYQRVQIGSWPGAGELYQQLASYSEAS